MRTRPTPMELEAVHEKRYDLEKLAESDLRTAKYARALLQAADAATDSETIR